MSLTSDPALEPDPGVLMTATISGQNAQGDDIAGAVTLLAIRPEAPIPDAVGVLAVGEYHVSADGHAIEVESKMVPLDGDTALCLRDALDRLL